jgi:hypothetical protein
MPMETPLRPGEALVKESRANLQRGIESVGGHVYLTDQRLIFESHSFNVQRGATEIPLAEVAEMRKAWTRFLNLIPIAPNTIAVRTTRGEEHRIVCSKRDEWIAAVEQQRGPRA